MRLLSCRRNALGLAEGVKLLPASEADRVAAQIALMQQSGVKYQDSHSNKRQKIMTESIFGAAPPAAQLPGGSSRHHSSSSRPGGGSSGNHTSSSSSGRGPSAGLGSRAPLPPHKPSRGGLSATLGSAAPGSSSSSRSAALQKQQLQQRVLLAKRRKQA
jgi:hypothetical protein